MKQLTNINLQNDPNAQHVQKEEIVTVCFAKEAGHLMSLEGKNFYVKGDAIITAKTGEQWVVSEDRFLNKYDAINHTKPGQDGQYKNKPLVILAKQMHASFQIARSPNNLDILTGESGDWLMQYALNDYGIVKAKRFAQVYKILNSSTSRRT